MVHFSNNLQPQHNAASNPFTSHIHESQACGELKTTSSQHFAYLLNANRFGQHGIRARSNKLLIVFMEGVSRDADDST